MQRIGTLGTRTYPISPCWDITTFGLLAPCLAAGLEFKLIKTKLLPSSEILRMDHKFRIPLLAGERPERASLQGCQNKAQPTGQQQPKAVLSAAAIFFFEALIFNTVTYVILLDTWFSSTFSPGSCKAELLN